MICRFKCVSSLCILINFQERKKIRY